MSKNVKNIGKCPKNLWSSKSFLLSALVIAVAERDRAFDDPQDNKCGDDLITDRPCQEKGGVIVESKKEILLSVCDIEKQKKKPGDIRQCHKIDSQKEFFKPLWKEERRVVKRHFLLGK